AKEEGRRKMEMEWRRKMDVLENERIMHDQREKQEAKFGESADSNLQLACAEAIFQNEDNCDEAEGEEVSL
nr:hypothetical protein [Tanacetum cinerariifolium]